MFQVVSVAFGFKQFKMATSMVGCNISKVLSRLPNASRVHVKYASSSTSYTVLYAFLCYLLPVIISLRCCCLLLSIRAEYTWMRSAALAERHLPPRTQAVNHRKISIENYTDEYIRLRAARKENPNTNPNPTPNSHDHCLLSKWICRTWAHTYLCNSLWIFSCD